MTSKSITTKQTVAVIGGGVKDSACSAAASALELDRVRGIGQIERRASVDVVGYESR